MQEVNCTCIDCEHCKPSLNVGYLCRHPEAAKDDAIMGQGYDAFLMRMSEAYCGEKGKWFKKKEDT